MMTGLTRNFFVMLIVFSLLVGISVSYMSMVNRDDVVADNQATATAVATHQPYRQMQNALSSSIARRALEMYETYPLPEKKMQIAMLLALEALQRREPGYDLAYPAQHAIRQVLTAGTAVELAERDDVSLERVEEVSRNGRWWVQVDTSAVGDAILHDQSAGLISAKYHLLDGTMHPVRAVRFSQNNRWLAIVREGEGHVYLWDLTAEEVDVHLSLGDGATEVTAVALSADGRWLATGSTDNVVRLWSLTAVDPAASMRRLAWADHDDNSLDRKGHQDDVTRLAFSPDSLWLATGGKDDRVLLWDLQVSDIGHWPILLEQPRADVQRLFFTPDGMQLRATTGDRVTHVWNVDWYSLVQKACLITGGQFDRAEWHDYMPDLPYRDTCAAWNENE